MYEINQNIPLSPIDYIFTGEGSQPITFAFYYPEKQDEKKLRNSLEESLKYFTVLKSRLKIISVTDSVFDITDDGLIFKVQHIDSAFDRKDNITKYISPVKTSERNPLTKVTLTHTQNGSVLAISISHALVDGFSYFHFLSSWARISKGERFIPPHIDRDLFSGIIHKSEKEITKENLLLNCGLFYGHRRDDTKTAANERLFIPADKIKEISERARNKNILLTENDVITGILWKKYLADWTKNDSSPETYLSFPFDFRRVLNGFPKNYFGCAVCFGTAKLSLKELLEKPEEDIAFHVKNSVSKIKNDYITNSINTLENFRNQKGRNEFEKLHLRYPENGIIITNISRLPVRELNFGNGAPTDVLTYAEVLRSAAILPAEGGVEILAASPKL
ncbi:MAG: acyltransferase [Ignavibacteriaceae bacterium]